MCTESALEVKYRVSITSWENSGETSNEILLNLSTFTALVAGGIVRRAFKIPQALAVAQTN